jgi:hypothetical protein
MQSATRQLKPIMPYPLCPHCGATIALDDVTHRGYDGNITCFECPSRFHIKVADESWPRLLSPPRPLGDPELLKGLTVPIVPKSLYNVYEKATLSLAAGIPEGAAFLCRYVIQQALLLKGIPDEAPDKMVNIAHSKKLLSETAFRQASAAVFMGGKAGHPQANWLDNIRSDDAKQALLLTRKILLELFNSSELA